MGHWSTLHWWVAGSGFGIVVGLLVRVYIIGFLATVQGFVGISGSALLELVLYSLRVEGFGGSSIHSGKGGT